MEIIDISVPVTPETVVWPDDPSFSAADHLTLDEHGVRVSMCSMGVHTGTHVDSPAHYLGDGQCIDRVPLAALIGPCVVLNLSAAGERITAEHLAKFDLRPGERVLLRTANSDRVLYAQPQFANDFSHLTADAARELADRGVQCVGIDYLSIGGMADNDETHRILMRAGIWIIEGLDLHAVAPGEYELICLPLKLVGLEGAPARAILRRMEKSMPAFVNDAMEYASRAG